jgi:hypothetical protein
MLNQSVAGEKWKTLSPCFIGRPAARWKTSLIPLRTLDRRGDGDPVRHLDAVRLQPIADLAPDLSRGHVALGQHLVKERAKIGRDGVGPWHGAQVGRTDLPVNVP